MSDLRIPNLFDDFARLRKDVDDLLRRAPQFDSPQPPEGCCAHYCCLDDTGYTVTPGSIQDTCQFEPDPVGGTGLRLKYDGWMRVRVVSTGSVSMVAWADVNGTAYDGAPKVTAQSGPQANDEFTIPLGGTIDVPIPDPVLTIRMQNLGGVNLQVVQVYTDLQVLPIEGDTSCGHAHAGTGPL